MRKLLQAADLSPSEDDLAEAYRSGFDAYMAAWNKGVHFGAREQLLHILRKVPCRRPRELIAATTREIEDASLIAPLQLLPGVRETVPRLVHAGYRLGIISDTSLTPGRLLKHFLEVDGLRRYFSALTFSDETGFTKPDRRMFAATLEALGADAEESAHIGDTPRTDIAGAQAMGMLSIRWRGRGRSQRPSGR